MSMKKMCHFWPFSKSHPSPNSNRCVHQKKKISIRLLTEKVRCVIENTHFQSTRHLYIFVFLSKNNFENFVRCVHQKKKLMICTLLFHLSICTSKNDEKDDTSMSYFWHIQKMTLVQKVIDVYIKNFFVLYGFWL